MEDDSVVIASVVKSYDLKEMCRKLGFRLMPIFFFLETQHVCCVSESLFCKLVLRQILKNKTNKKNKLQMVGVLIVFLCLVMCKLMQSNVSYG